MNFSWGNEGGIPTPFKAFIMEQDSGETKNFKVGLIATIVLVGFLAAVASRYVLAYYDNFAYPYNTFLFIPSDHFMDFFNPYRFNQALIPYSSGFGIAYFPFTQVIFYLLGLVFREKVAYVVSMVLFLGLFVTLIRNYAVDSILNKFFKFQVLIILSFLSYPLITVVDRGNIEFGLFAFLLLFFYLYYERRSRWSFLFLAMAISTKLYPATLLVLLISERKYRQAVYTALTAVAITLGSYWFLAHISGNTLLGEMRLHIENLRIFAQAADTNNGIRFGHTIWGMIAGVNNIFLGNRFDLNAISSYYSVVTVLAFAGIAAYVVFLEKAVWRKVTLLIIAMIMLPNGSYDYTMINLFIPLVLFLNTNTKRQDSIAYSLLFGLLMIPVNYYYLINDVSISIFIYPLIMCTIMFSIMTQGIKRATAYNHSLGRLPKEHQVEATGSQ